MNEDYKNESKNENSIIYKIIKNKWIISISLIYFILSAAWLLARHNSFITGGYDLGQYTQIFWNTVNGNGILTTDLRIREGNLDGFYLWEHFAPILFLFVPIFYIAPGPETLLVIKALFISLSILILWFVAKNNLDRKLAMVVVISYTLNPFLFRGLNFDFQEQFILPFIIFSEFYFYFEKRYGMFALFTILGLTVNEYSAALSSASMFGLAITEYANTIEQMSLKHIKNIFGGSLREFLDRVKDKRVSIPLLMAVISGIYFVIVMSIMGYYADAGIYASYVDQDAFSDERISAVETMNYYITHPSVVLGKIAKDILNKVQNLNMFLMTTFYLPLLSPVSLLPIGLYTLFGWLIDKPTFYSYGNHHALYVIPYAYIGLILSIKNFNFDWSRISNSSRSLIFGLAIVISILLFSYEVSSLIDRGSYPNSDEHNKRLQYIISLIPENASILAQNNIHPHVAMRKNSYSGINQYDQILKTKGFIDFEYVIIDENGNKRQFERIKPLIERLIDINSTDYYGPWIYSDGIYVLKRDYRGPMGIYVENQTEGFKTTYTAKDLKLRSGYVEKDILVHSSNDKSRVFWYGPYKLLPAGNYKATFRIKKDGDNFDSKKRLITLDVIKNEKDKLVSKDVNYSDVNKGWTNISLTFSIDTFVPDIEFRGVGPSPATYIYLRDITVEEVIPTKNDMENDIEGNVGDNVGNDTINYNDTVNSTNNDVDI